MARAKKEESTKVPKKGKQSFDILNKTTDILFKMVDKNYDEINSITARSEKFQSIINREINIDKGASGGSIIDFTMKLRQDNSSKGINTTLNNSFAGSKDPYAVLSNYSGDLFSLFQDYYNNRYVEIQDLKFISKFIPALGEAVKVTANGIASGDETTSSLLRNINIPENLSSSEKDNVLSRVESAEKKYKLKKIIKNIIVPNTLTSGSLFVYAVDYKTLFSRFSELKSKMKNISPMTAFGNATEAYESFVENYTLESFIPESTMLEFANESFIKDTNSNPKNSDIKAFVESFATISKVDMNIPLEICDELFAMEALGDELPQTVGSKNSSTRGKEVETYAEAVVSNKGTTDGRKTSKIQDFKKTKGIYIKVLDFKRIIPIKIFDDVVGYYYIHSDKKKFKDAKNRVSIPGVLDSLNYSQNSKEQIINNMVDSISAYIIKNFSEKFVDNNNEFKKAIADCIIYNGFANKEYKIQFIPASDVIEFKINEDEDNNGQSILKDSLFPAKMLLSILVCKMLFFMNKSGNRTIMHTYKGSIDPTTGNHVQRIIRNLQESDVNFGDMLSTNLLFGKLSRNSNIIIPKAQNGNNLIEFETMEGQNVDLSTEFEKKLEDMTVLGTGVPTVIMEYSGQQLEFARQITTANIKFAGSISELQADFEESITELYKRCIIAEEDDEKMQELIKNNFSVSLPRPKVLSNNNVNEYLSNVEQTAQTMANILYGQNDDSNETKRLKELFVKKYVVDNTPFIDWTAYDEAVRKALIERVNEKEITGKEDEEEEQ